MIKYVLAGGSMHKALDGGKSFCEEVIKGISGKPVKILDCLFARDRSDWDGRLKDDQDFFSKNIKDFELELAIPGKFLEQVKNSDVVFFQGGVPRQLVSLLPVTDDWIKELQGKVLVGSSGGADVISKYYGVGKTGNIGEGLGLLPIKIIPHWKSDYDQELTINWDSLFEKLKAHKDDLEIVVLREGEFKIIEK